MFRSLTALLLALATFPTLARADEPLVLRSGEVLLGEVKEVDDDKIEFLAHFPAEKQMTIPRADISDSSLWRILSRRIPAGDLKARLNLGRWAEERGLLAPALAEYRRASKAEAHRKEALQALAGVEDKLAAILFDRGEEQFALQEFTLARPYFRLILERYPKSPPAQMAGRRLELIDQQLAAASKAKKANDAEVPRSLSSWKDTIERATKLAKRAAPFEQKAVHGSTASKQIKILKQAIRVLERAWEEVGSLGPDPHDAPADLKAYARALTASTKQRLVSAYLTSGMAYLLRSSLARADEYCAKACKLAPEDKEIHDLHKRLIEARLINEWGGISHGRVAGGSR